MSLSQHALARADALTARALAAIGDGRRDRAGTHLDELVSGVATDDAALELARSLIARARWARACGDLAAARNDLEGASAILDRSSSDADDDTARLQLHTAVERAATAVMHGRVAAATEGLQRALTVGERVLGRHDVEVAFAMGHLGALHRVSCRVDDAERHWRRALIGLEAARGPDYLDVELERVFTHLAALRPRRGRVVEAGTLLQRAADLAQLRASLGDAFATGTPPGGVVAASPVASTSFEALALGSGDGVRAARVHGPPGLYRQLLPALASALGDPHMDVRATRRILATLLEEQRRFGEAAAELTITHAATNGDASAVLHALARLRLREGHLRASALLYARASVAALRARRRPR